MVGRIAIRPQECEVLDIGTCFCLLAVNGIGESHNRTVSWHPKPQGERLPGGSTAVAFLAGHLSHSRIEEPRSLSARFLAVSSVGRGEIAIGKSLLKNRFSHLPVQSSAI